MLTRCFSLWSPKFCYWYVVLPGHLSQHAKAATAEGLTFSDPMLQYERFKLNLPTKLLNAKRGSILSILCFLLVSLEFLVAAAEPFLCINNVAVRRPGP
jgi:hypothetical protein